MQLCFNTINSQCPSYPDAKCVVYTGANLPCTGIKTNDRLDKILGLIEAKICTGSGGGNTFIDPGTGIKITGSGTPLNHYVVTSYLSIGISGGQSAIGGTLAGNSLTLSSTTNVTKGKIIFGTSCYDEANNRLGIGTLAPTQDISIKEKMWMYVGTGVDNNKGFVATSLNQTLFLTGGVSNVGVLIRPNPYALIGGYVGFSHTDPNQIDINFVSGGALECGRIGLQNTGPNPLEFYLKPLDGFKVTLYDDIRIDNYPSSRNDGTTTHALYVDATGFIKYGPVSSSGTIITTFPIVSKSANYTAGPSDYTINCTANTFTITLPTAIGVPGRVYIIKNTGGGEITLATTAGQTIDGDASETILPSTLLAVQSDGANWIVIGH